MSLTRLLRRSRYMESKLVHRFHLHSEINLLSQNVSASSLARLICGKSMAQSRRDHLVHVFSPHLLVVGVLRKRRNLFGCCFCCVLSGLQRRHLEHDGFRVSAAVSQCQHAANLFWCKRRWVRHHSIERRTELCKVVGTLLCGRLFRFQSAAILKRGRFACVDKSTAINAHVHVAATNRHCRFNTSITSLHSGQRSAGWC